MSNPSDFSAPNGRRRFTLFGKKDEGYVVTGYEIGTIHTAQNVFIPQGTAVAGDVIGEKVRVSGQVFGNLIARHIIIEGSGIVWGDLYAREISAAPGATIRGWLNTLDEPTIIEYQNSGQPPPQPETNPSMVPVELQRAVDALNEKLSPDRAVVLNKLTAELAAARLARFELEESFENRLQTISAERVTEAETLRDEVEVLQRERVASQQKAGELTANLQQAQEALGQLQTLLQEKEAEMTQQLAELESLRASEGEKLAYRTQLEEENQRYQDDLDAMSRRAEELADRIKSLEAALKASNQRSAEQEQALVHWQELAEINEKAAQDAKESLDDLSYTVKQNAILVENLQLEKERLTRQLSESEITESEVKPTTPSAESSSADDHLLLLKEELARKTKEVDLNKHALLESTAAYNQASRHITQLENQLEALQIVEEKRGLWEDRIFALDDQLEISELKRAKSERDLAEAHDLLLQQEEMIKALNEKVNYLQPKRGDGETTTSEQSEVSDSRLTEQLKKQYSRDLEYLSKQLAFQGQTLAETRASLIEKQLQVEELQKFIQLLETQKTSPP